MVSSPEILGFFSAAGSNLGGDIIFGHPDIAVTSENAEAEYGTFTGQKTLGSDLHGMTG